MSPIENITACKAGKHQWLQIWSDDKNLPAIVSWCEICGGVSVDAKYAGRILPGHYRKAQGPALMTKYYFYIDEDRCCE